MSDAIELFSAYVGPGIFCRVTFEKKYEAAVLDGRHLNRVGRYLSEAAENKDAIYLENYIP